MTRKVPFLLGPGARASGRQALGIAAESVQETFLDAPVNLGLPSLDVLRGRCFAAATDRRELLPVVGPGVEDGDGAEYPGERGHSPAASADEDQEGAAGPACPAPGVAPDGTSPSGEAGRTEDQEDDDRDDEAGDAARVISYRGDHIRKVRRQIGPNLPIGSNLHTIPAP